MQVWVRLRQTSDRGAALAQLDAVVEEIRSGAAGTSIDLLHQELWLARIECDYRDRDRGVQWLADLIGRVEQGRPSTDPLALDAQLWRGGNLGLLGRHAEAIQELRDNIVRRIELQQSPESEGMLTARLRLACSLADSGQPDVAIPEFDEVVARRELVDSPEAPNLVAALHGRAVCRSMLGDGAAAIADLDRVIEMRSAGGDATRVSLLGAKNQRAVLFMTMQRWPEALAALDEIVATVAPVVAQADADLNNLRQQRAVCLLGLGRGADAVAQLDQIIVSIESSYPADHPQLMAAREMRRAVAVM